MLKGNIGESRVSSTICQPSFSRAWLMAPNVRISRRLCGQPSRPPGIVRRGRRQSRQAWRKTKTRMEPMTTPKTAPAPNVRNRTGNEQHSKPERKRRRRGCNPPAEPSEPRRASSEGAPRMRQYRKRDGTAARVKAMAHSARIGTQIPLLGKLCLEPGAVMLDKRRRGRPFV